jgi:hypothetical protein
MNSGGKGNNRRRPFRRRERDNESWARDGKKKDDRFQYDKNRGIIHERPKWTPPKMSTEPIPAPDCSYCGKPIRDISTAIQDTASDRAIHFDCVIEKIAKQEPLEKGDAVTYIGGGRFGIVHFNHPGGSQGRSGDLRNFTIKKIFEWENKEHRAEWRKIIADHYSIT